MTSQVFFFCLCQDGEAQEGGGPSPAVGAVRGVGPGSALVLWPPARGQEERPGPAGTLPGGGSWAGEQPWPEKKAPRKVAKASLYTWPCVCPL